MDRKIGFKTNMFVYALESGTNLSRIKVAIPQAFMQDISITPGETKLQKGNNSIFLNAIPPALNTYVTSYNYITLPVIGSGVSNTTIGNNTYSGTTGIGRVSKGDRLIAEFTNSNPIYGLIIARC